MERGDGEGTLADGGPAPVILTPDQRVRVFVSSTLEELAPERVAVRDAVDRMHLSPVLFELGARAHPPRSLYRSYLEQSHVFVGIYWERYGWVAPTEQVSGLEDEYLLSGGRPKLMYIKRPAPKREERLEGLLDRIRADDDVAYKAFTDAAELQGLVTDDLSLLLSEAFLVLPQAAPDAPAGPHRFTLPADVTTLIGREAEVDELVALLGRDDVRMVTLTGAGGVGKTRLALRVAAQAAPAFAEGAAFVSLASVSDERSVAGAVAAAVGLRTGAAPTVAALADDLASRSLLLLVDNFEHVVGAAGILSELLSAAPGIKVLATSREALHLQAEHEFPVPPLDADESLRLFAERASAVRPGFVIDDGNRDVVERICRRLDGVPLAIELAAARTKLLTPEALLGRLDRQLAFLVGGARDLPERHQALRRTIEWSYDLLDDAERRVLALVGVFVGGFSLSAAEAVDDGGVDTLDLLASLVDKSLVRVEATAGEPRFRMLEMIREFARDRLSERDDAELVAERHATFFRDVAVTVGAGVTGGDQRRGLAVLGDDDHGEAGNVREALAWFLAHGRIDEVADMAWALWVPLWIHGGIHEGRTTAQAALAAGAMSETARARLLVVLGMFQMWSGDHEAAADALGQGRTLGHGLGDDALVAAATLAESMMAGPAQGEARCEQLAEAARAMYRNVGDAWGEAAALNALGWLYVSQERFEGTEEVFEQTLTSSLAAGDEQFSALAEVNLAEALLHGGRRDDAAALLASSAARHRPLRLMYSVAYLLDACARLASVDGDPSRAVQLLGAASQLRTTAGVAVWGSQLVRRDRLLDELRTALGDGAFRAALEAGTRLCYADALDRALPIAPQVPRPETSPTHG